MAVTTNSTGTKVDDKPDKRGTGSRGGPRTRLTVPTISTSNGTLYRGREGMWSWVGHRITGVLIFVFLLTHVLDTSLVRVSPEAYDAVIGTYKNPVTALGEAGLVAAVVFHAFNGLRIMLVDFWGKGARYQRQMFYGVLGIFVLLYVPFIVRHLSIAWFGAEG